LGGVLHIRLRTLPPTVILWRDGDVPEELWNALGRNIAPDDYRQEAGEFLIPLERFLARRNWLASALRTYDCSIEVDATAAAELERENSERDEIDVTLAGGVLDVPFTDVGELLRGSRFVRELKQFQIRDLTRLLALSHGANYSVPGAGKTAVAYACYEAERARGRVDRLLVVAPLSAFEAWTTEAEKCMRPTPVIRRIGEQLPHNPEVQLVNYQRLASSYQNIATWVVEGRCHVILDEAHRMKRGRNGEWGSVCLDLAHLAVRRDVLTGTPAPQHPRDFIALVDFLWPHQSTRILPAAALRPHPPDTAMAEVSRRLRPLFVRTTKSELGLDKPRLHVEFVPMKPIQSEIYEALRSRMRNAVAASARERAQFGHMGEVVMYLLEAATNPGLLTTAIDNSAPKETTWPPMPVEAGSSLADRVLRYTQHEIPPKFEKLAAMVAAQAGVGRKTLVWSNFVANLDNLAATVLAPYNPVVIHGAIPSSSDLADERTREHALRCFREDDECMVLLANPAAMSEGVSLHEHCHDAIYVDRTFNAGQYLQSVDRIHRLGLEPGIDTNITFLVSQGTVDETVDDRVRIKAERLSLMLSDPDLVTMALPDEEAYGEWVEADDLDALFAHLRHG